MRPAPKSEAPLASDSAQRLEALRAKAAALGLGLYRLPGDVFVLFHANSTGCLRGLDAVEAFLDRVRSAHHDGGVTP